MKITVFGASGGTGRQIVRQAVEDGHEVTAVVREGASTEGLEGARLTRAQVTDPAAIAPAVEGADAVISAIGTRSSGFTTICQDATRSITEAMRTAGTDRLVVISSAVVTTAGDGPFTRILVKPMLRRLLRHAVTDAARMEQHLRETDLDWTVVRPPRLTDGARAGRYRTARESNVRGGFLISRADLAAAILAALADRDTARAAVGVAA